jgi:Mn2+/Fe2+ NRAMP family transporter
LPGGRSFRRERCSEQGNLITLLIGSQVLQGVVAPIVLTYILILANRRSVLGDAVNTRAFQITATLAVAAVAAMSLLLVGQTLLGLVGLG